MSISVVSYRIHCNTAQYLPRSVSFSLHMAGFVVSITFLASSLRVRENRQQLGHTTLSNYITVVHLVQIAHAPTSVIQELLNSIVFRELIRLVVFSAFLSIHACIVQKRPSQCDDIYLIKYTKNGGEMLFKTQPTIIFFIEFPLFLNCIVLNLRKMSLMFKVG